MVDTLFFIAAKLFWLFISPDSLLLIFLLIVVLLLVFKRVSSARKIVFTTVFIALIITLFPVGEWLGRPLEERFQTNPSLPASINGIIVLGGSENEYLSYLWDQPELNASAERLITFVTLARQYPDAKLVHSGGSGNLIQQAFKQSGVARRLYNDLGLDTRRVIFEAESRNTFENVKNSKALVSPQKGEKWVVITSATHMVRTVGIFRQQGWDVIPFPVDHRGARGDYLRMTYNFAGNLHLLKLVVYEWVGLVTYWATGKTSVLFPK